MHRSPLLLRRGAATLALIPLYLAVGCGGAPESAPRLEPPPIGISIKHWNGTVLTGHQPGMAPTDDLDPAACVGVSCEIYYLLDAPQDELQPIAGHTRLVVGAAGGEALLPVSELSFGMRVGSGEAATAYLASLEQLAENPARFARVASLRGALPIGASITGEAESPELLVSDDRQVVQRRSGVLLSREAEDQFSVAVMLDDLALRRDDDEEAASRSVFKRQIILLEDAPVIDGAPVVLLEPSRFDPTSSQAFCVVITLHSSADSDVVAQCDEDLRAEGALAAERGTLGAQEIARRSMAAGLLALDTARKQRPGLVFLAASSGAALSLDLALAADDSTVAAWVQSMEIETGEELGPRPTVAAVGWLLDRTAFGLLGGRLDRAEISDEMRALLAQHAGEVGRFPGALTAILARSKDRESFDRALAAENLDFLSTSDPSARVRAYDWLAARDLAPPEYDPLGSRQERRAALTAAEQSEEVAR